MKHPGATFVLASMSFAILACGAPTVDPAARSLTLEDLHGDWRSDEDQGLRIGWAPGMAQYQDPKRPELDVDGPADVHDGVITIRKRSTFREFDHVERFAIVSAPRLEPDCRMWMQLGSIRLRRLTPEVEPERCVSDPADPVG